MPPNPRSLNVTTNHCVHKKDGVVFAFQELVANALDASRGLQEPSVTFVSAGVTIQDYGRGLCNADFRLGQTTCLKGTIGSFGVGLVDAVAIFCRVGAEVSVETQASKFTFPKDADGTILLKEEKLAGHTQGTLWRIKGNFMNLKEKVLSRFLVFTPRVRDNCIVRRSDVEVYETHGQGVCFVNGVLVEGTPSNLGLSYNFPNQDMQDFGREHKVAANDFSQMAGVINLAFEQNSEKVLKALQKKETAAQYKPRELKWKWAGTPSKAMPKKKKRAGKQAPVATDNWTNGLTNGSGTQKSKRLGVVDYDAAVKCADWLKKVEGNNDDVCYIGQDRRAMEQVGKPKQNRTFVEAAAQLSPLCRGFALGLCARTPGHETATVYAEITDDERAAMINILAGLNLCNVKVVPLLDYTLPIDPKQLDQMFVANLLEERSVQGIKERVEETLKGINCTVRLGGSLSKGVATKSSDVDLIVSVKSTDVSKAMKAVSEATYVAELKEKRDALLAIVNTPTGSVDVVVTSYDNQFISNDILDKELGWFSGIKNEFPIAIRAVVLIKVWVRRNKLKVKGSAVENLVAEVCDKENIKGGTQDDLLKGLTGAFTYLARNRVIRAHYPPNDDLMRDVDSEEWGAIQKAVEAQLEKYTTHK